MARPLACAGFAAHRFQQRSGRQGPINPNVILVLTDDQGYGDLGCHGNPIVRTPHLDRFHAESVRFTNYHVGPTCAPTRAGLLTGRYANSAGVWHTIGGRSLLRTNEFSLADAFRDNGYATGIFGKWHLGDNYPYRPQDRGFDEVVVHGGGGVGNTPDYWGNCYFDDSYWTGQAYQAFPGYCTDVWFREGLRFIAKQRTRPFFCYIATNAPHSPHLVEPRYSDPYLERTPDAERAKFYGMIANIDENFGALRARLQEWGLADNTILIFMTDNGSAGGVCTDAAHFVVSGFNAGMRGQKGSPYEGGHRVPFFLHWPRGGLATGRDASRLAANVDVMPTLADLCRLALPTDLDWDGRSLRPLLEDAAAPWPDRALVTDSQRLAYPVKWRQSAVMTQRWRLINGVELYDMQSDPGQTRDQAARELEVVRALRQAYETWWARVAVQMDADIPIPVGGDVPARETAVNSHDWRNHDCACVWNQNQVRAGLRYNGHWELDVAEAGRYRFELRRWPRTENRALRAGLPGPVIALSDMTVDSGYGGGRALPIVGAAIEVGGHRAQAALDRAAPAAVFEFVLERGPVHLQTFFRTEDGADLGAYYVYITQLDGKT